MVDFYGINVGKIYRSDSMGMCGNLLLNFHLSKGFFGGIWLPVLKNGDLFQVIKKTEKVRKWHKNARWMNGGSEIRGPGTLGVPDDIQAKGPPEVQCLVGMFLGCLDV